MKLNRKDTLVSVDGGRVDFLIDGEVVGSLPILPGKTPAREVLSLVSPGMELAPDGDISVVGARSWNGRQPYGRGSHDSGANPDFRPSSASGMEKQLRGTLSRVQSIEKRLLARERALAGLAQSAKPPKDDPEVIEREAPAAKPTEAPKPEGGGVE